MKASVLARSSASRQPAVSWVSSGESSGICAAAIVKTRICGVNSGDHTCKVLRRHGIACQPVGIWDAHDIAKDLHQHPETTHALIEAPFIGATHIHDLLLDPFPHVQLVCRNHSQIGFLQVEPGGIQQMRDYGHLEELSLNFKVASNAARFVHWYERSYHARCLYLPNLYDLERCATKANHLPHDHKLLRIASFGSLRILKNHATAAAAAQLIARNRGSDLEFWISTNRSEQGRGLIDSLRKMFTGLHWAKLVENAWEDWSHFRRTVAHMDLCLQVSMTETFNLTSADALAEGVPSVVSDAIEWCPTHWQAHIDDAEDIARVGNNLLADRYAAEDGREALTSYLRAAVPLWLHWLGVVP